MARTNGFVKIYRECNASSNYEKWRRLQEEMPNTVGGGPLYIDIELTNYCNINCYMCPVGTRAMRRPRGFMSMDTVAKICSELANSSIQGVRLIRWGEPTMHPQFLEILKKLKETGKLVHFNTNGTLLNPESIQTIIDLEIDSVKFSFQGVDKESYEEMRYGSSWEKLMENIQIMNRLRDSREKPYIQISTTITSETKEQIDAFIENMTPLCDYINIGRTEMCHLDVEKMNISKERKEKSLQLKERESMHKQHLTVCPEVYDKLSVNWDGTVTACCGDYDNTMVVGNLGEESLGMIYCGEKLREIRRIISRDAYDEIPLCRMCYQYIELQT